MIAMGSILEFLLERYCKRKEIKPELYNDKKGETFSNYIEAAIKNEIFGDKKYWELVQTHIRDFRNYIHIQKEVKSSKLDFNWYKIIKPVFDYLLKNFQKVSAQELS